MKKLAVLLYGFVNYNLGSAALVILIAFLFNLVPLNHWLNGIDSGETGSTALAVIINLSLVTLFGIQHSIMARPRFKRWLRRFIPEAAERSTYMLATAVVVFVLCAFWQPMPAIIWKAESAYVYYGLMAVGLGGWGLVLYSTFIISHFDLFGLRQVWLYFRRRTYTPLQFKEQALYRFVRHPIMTGAFIGIWFTPVMTVGHLLFAVGMSVYVFIGVYHEERDLVSIYGKRYRDYMQRTGRFFPKASRAPAQHERVVVDGT